MYRLRPKQKAYDRHLQQTGEFGCPFCEIDDPNLNPQGTNIIEETEHCLVIENIFGYDAWEGRKVTAHYMAVPKRHAHSLGDLTATERTEMMDLYCKYEAADYNVYSRAPGSGARSHVHLHTHFIKTAGGPPRHLTYTRKPYSLIITW